MIEIFNSDFSVLNIGVEKFYTDLAVSGFSVINKKWKPVLGGDPELSRKLSALADDNRGLGLKIKDANQKAFRRMVEAKPILKGIEPAYKVLKNMSPTTVLHAGPPIEWEQMCGAMRGAIIGGLIYEKLASCQAEAEELAESGKIEFAPCHSRDAVGPMAGIITAHMPVMIVENEIHGTTGFATMNEGWGKTLRFGSFDDEVIQRLIWMQTVLAPVLNNAIQDKGGINIQNLIARALHMGDECHNRDIAATALFFKEIIPAIIKVCPDEYQMASILDFLSPHEHFFLNICMAASKANMLAGHNIPYSTMITAMARNGVEVGLLMSGAGTEWFTGKAEIPEGLYFPGCTAKDAGPDLGDSAITETAGLGAFAMAGAPAIVRFVGGTPADAVRYTKQMEKITLGNHPQYTIPALDFKGTPAGIDTRLVIESGIVPVINTGIAHKEPGHGLIGAGVVRAPFEAFVKAIEYSYSNFLDKNGRKNDQ
jgi:Protein of unknown function (DUF1116)